MILLASFEAGRTEEASEFDCVTSLACERVQHDLVSLANNTGISESNPYSLIPVKRALPPPRLPEISDPVPPFGGVTDRGNVWASDGGQFAIDDRGIPSQLHSTYGPLLQGAMRISLGRSVSPLIWGKPEIIANEPGGVRWRAFARSDGVNVMLTGTYHFDGLLTIGLDWTDLNARAPLLVQLPLTADLGRHVVAREAIDLSNIRGEVHRFRLVPQTHSTVALPFTHWLQLANDTHGLVLLSASDEGWANGDTALPIRLHAESDQLTLELDFGIKSGQRRVEFGIQLLPLRSAPVLPHSQALLTAQVPDAKSMKARIRQSDRSAHGLSSFPQTIIVHQSWTDIQGYPDASSRQAIERLRGFVAEAHSRGSQVLVYLGAELSTAAPLWETHAAQTVAIPFRPGRRRGQVRAWRPGGAGPAFIEHFAKDVGRLLDATGADGLFLDMLSDARPSVNPWAALGYRSATGEPHAEMPWYEVRDLMLAIALEVRQRNPSGRIACHVAGVATPGQSMCNYLLLGEQELAEGRIEGLAQYLELLRPERLRAMYNPHRRGLPMQWLVKPSRGGAGMDRVASSTLQLDIPVRTQWPHFISAKAAKSMLNPAQDVVRFWRLQSQRLPFGRWFPWWAPQPVAIESHPDLYVSTRVAARFEGAETIVSNLGSRERCTSLAWYATSAKGGRIDIDEATDLIGDIPLDVVDGRAALCVPPNQVVVVRLSLSESLSEAGSNP